MKKIINKKENVVKEMLQGILLENQDILVNEQFSVVYKKNMSKNKVNLISGGGSGHEPSHAGYVAKGMLDAAVCGEVFTSPTPDMIQKAVELCESDKGILLIVKNYTGDIMNFEIAKMQNQNVEMVVVDDDVAVENSTYTTGRRGIAGTIFVHKIAGAAAETLNLSEVKRIAEKVIKNTRTMGLSLGHCIVPASGKPSFNIKEDEIEVGLGIHGEPGVRKEKITYSKELVKKLLDKIIKDLDYENSEVALLVNGLGGTPIMELYIANNDAHSYLKDKNINVCWNKVGNYMTSLEMPGISLTLLKLDDELKKLLFSKTCAKGWK